VAGKQTSKMIQKHYLVSEMQTSKEKNSHFQASSSREWQTKAGAHEKNILNGKERGKESSGFGAHFTQLGPPSWQSRSDLIKMKGILAVLLKIKIHDLVPLRVFKM